MSGELTAPTTRRVHRTRDLPAEGHRFALFADLAQAAVSELGPVAQADLGPAPAIDPKDLVGILNDLRADGLTVRTPAPRDRHKNAVTITPAGQNPLRRCTNAAQEANDRLLAPLAPAEARRLLALLTRLHEA
ncbi:MarR family winged helix-turn-helix transcriptional regulator [Streptomyces sp. NPDC048361]|uniref:MarR family winged helix-turn-helix transcriptional regulator n=1 Tax=Streptomyces sp. NPDC048361 TaxID=3154720 RepID=UPI00341C3CB0